MVLPKGELERQLKDEHEMIATGEIRDDSPLDKSTNFQLLCLACRTGDLKTCQEAINTGVNINARDEFDNTPLILSSLCGHYEVCTLLLESGALCERDTFQGERCLYNALNNRIRNLLLKYDYSKSTDPLQPLASHIGSLMTRDTPKTSDIRLSATGETWNLHKFILSARSPYFSNKLTAAPETKIWKLSNTIPPEAFRVAVEYLYFGEVPLDLGLTNESLVTEEEVFKGIDKISKLLQIESLWEGVLSGKNRRVARQRYQDEVGRGRDQLEQWYRTNVLGHRLFVESKKARDVKWTRDNAIFADVLLRADIEDGDTLSSGQQTPKANNSSGIPIGPSSQSTLPTKKPKQSVLFPVHRAMLIRSEYFQTMFSSSFQEAQITEYLQVIRVDCSPEVLEIVLQFLYTENAEIPIQLALDTLFVADMLFMEKLKNKATTIISTIGSGSLDRTHLEATDEVEVEPINVYDIIHAGWFLKIRKLEEFSARYLAYRLEDYIEEEDFLDLIKESASKIIARQQTDTIELVDDIRYYLSERFRLRFEDSLFSELEDRTQEENASAAKDPPAVTNPDTAIDNAISTPKLTLPPLDLPRSNDDVNSNKQILALNGQIAPDEFAADSINYEFLLEKIDSVLDMLKLDA